MMMKTNWLVLLSFAVVYPFMLYGADNAGASTLTTIAKVPLTQGQIIILAKQAVDHGITPQTCRYEATLQKKIVRLLTFRSKMQPANLRRQSARHIINQQCLYRGHIQANQYTDTTAALSDSNKQSWSSIFEKKMLTESADEQAEISWAHETASLLIQYWPTCTAYQSRKKREEIKNFTNSVADDAATDAQPSTIAKVPLTQDQITTIAQQAIANCITSQTCRYEATLQKKLATLLAFRSQLQPVNLRNHSARFIINRQNLDHGCTHVDQHAGITSSSSASSKQSWCALFRNKLLIKSVNEQTEIAWAHETASLLVQYWQAFNAYKSQKKRERITHKREQPYDSVEEIDELLRKNRRHNDSPVPFVPIADEQISVSQTPVSTSFDLLMHSNHDVLDAAFFQKANPDSMVFDLPTPTIETYDFSWMEEHDED